jgi:nucleoside-diphosphate-sugar epimerase
MNLKCLVTGAAGFIGSHLAERLVAERYEVIGVDCFTDYYPRLVKKRRGCEPRLRGSG